MKRNQKGFTTVELLVSAVILLIIIVSSYKFFETYDIRSAEIGEYETAQLLAVNAIENQRTQIKEGNYSTGMVFRNEMYANQVKFASTVEKENVTDDYTYFGSSVPLFKLTSTVSWRNSEVEVVTYVSGR